MRPFRSNADLKSALAFAEGIAVMVDPDLLRTDTLVGHIHVNDKWTWNLVKVEAEDGKKSTPTIGETCFIGVRISFDLQMKRPGDNKWKKKGRKK